MYIFKIYTDTFYKNTRMHINFFAHIIMNNHLDYSRRCVCFFLTVIYFFFTFFFFCKDSCAAKQLEVKALKGLDYKKVKTKQWRYFLRRPHKKAVGWFHIA